MTSQESEADRTIRLYGESLDRLKDFSVRTDFVEGKHEALVTFDRDRGWDGVFCGPDEESRHTIVPTLRLLIRDGEDRISLRRVAEAYEQLGVPEDISSRFGRARSRVDALLDRETNVGIEDTKNLTYRDVVEIFVFGILHVRGPRPDQLRDLRSTALFPILELDFSMAVGHFLRQVPELEAINKAALQSLSSRGEAEPGQA